MGCQALPSGACKDELSLGEIGKDKVVGAMPLAGQPPACSPDGGSSHATGEIPRSSERPVRGWRWFRMPTASLWTRWTVAAAGGASKLGVAVLHLDLVLSQCLPHEVCRRWAIDGT